MNWYIIVTLGCYLGSYWGDYDELVEWVFGYFEPGWRGEAWQRFIDDEVERHRERDARRRAKQGWQLVFRDVADSTNERTTIAAIVPDAGLAHTVGIVGVGEFGFEEPEEAEAEQGTLL